MPRFVALLRGINVGGNPLKMDRLREICADLKLKNVQTYLQSGNVIFEAAGGSKNWAEKMELKLARETRLPVAVMCRTAQQLESIRANNPFLKEKDVDPVHCYVTFLSGEMEEGEFTSLLKINAGADRLIPFDNVIYLHCPGGYGRSKLSNNVIEKKLGVRATTRNWNTVNQLHAMLIAEQ